jgi:hypothetical protein
MCKLAKIYLFAVTRILAVGLVHTRDFYWGWSYWIHCHLRCTLCGSFIIGNLYASMAWCMDVGTTFIFASIQQNWQFYCWKPVCLYGMMHGHGNNFYIWLHTAKLTNSACCIFRTCSFVVNFCLSNLWLPELYAHCTLQMTVDWNGCPLLSMLFAHN